MNFLSFFVFVILNYSLLIFSASSETSSATFHENKIEYKKAYFAGGCFWCMEESFDKVKGVVKSISGYSGGHVKNPTYKQVVYEDTGHVEAITVFYNSELTSYEELLKVFWENIDPFDSNGQFCDKGKSYRSVAFYETLQQKQFIQSSMLNIEKKFNKKKVVTLVWKFEKFYPAEDYHQDYYQNNFLRYLAYKKRCQREEILNKIWN
ncbi:peptide-methionine (S)-S-oxide reductase MsrA [Pelagibacteraceae bacterium]|nr:peptide-methionine (S)-S-oxide reductase MsrA [Pelagibacteraceae bacterium]